MHGGKPVICEGCLSAGQGAVASLGGEAGGLPGYPFPTRRLSGVSWAPRSLWGAGSACAFAAGLLLFVCPSAPFCPLLSASAPALGLLGRALWVLSFPINLTYIPASGTL